MNDEQIALGEVDPGLGIATIGCSTADSLMHRGVILTDLGRFEGAVAAFQRAEDRARCFGENEVANWIDFLWAGALERAGDASGALSTARRAIESAEKIGSVLGRVMAHASYGMACVLAEKWQSARESLDFALELGRARRAGLFLEPYYVAALAEAHLGLGDAPRARQVAEAAHEIAERAQMRVAEVRALLARVRVLLTLDGVAARAEVESILERALALVHSTGARSFEPQIHVERARLAGLLSDVPGRQQWLREALRLFTEMGATGHAERVARELS
jgi:tetratricopeptide (TPR) repeat protein